MLQSLRIILCGLSLLLSTLLFSQTTAELFSIPGLVVGSYSQNDVGQQSPTGYAMYEKTVSGDTTNIGFIHNEGWSYGPMMIVGKKVYRGNADTKVLLYDFDVVVGDTIKTGIYRGSVVTDRYQLPMDDGSERLAIKVELDTLIWNYQQTLRYTYVEGIGDLRQGLFPYEPLYYNVYESSFLSCVKVYEEVIYLASSIENCEIYGCPHPIKSFEITQDSLTISIENNSLRWDNCYWDFGDGNTSSEANPSHSYDQPGCYQISMRLGNQCFGLTDPTIREIQVCQQGPWFEQASMDSTISGQVNFVTQDVLFFWNRAYLHRSYDNGISWEKVNIPLPSNPIERQINGSDMYDEERGLLICSYTHAPIDYGAILKTIDGGNTWGETNMGSIRMVDLTLGQNGLAWATGFPNSLYISEDYGDNWITINYQDTFLVLDIYPISQLSLLASIWVWEDDSYLKYIGKSENGGLSWDLKRLPAEMDYIEIADANNIYGYDYFNVGLQRTLNQGDSWELIMSERITEVEFLNKDEGWISGVNGNLFYTTDGMNTYEQTQCGGGRKRSITSVESGRAAAISNGTIQYFDFNAKGTCLLVDSDMDGFTNDIDCDDTNAAVNPSAIEIPYNEWDDDCDSLTLDDDLDQDGFLLADDCDDENELINPDANDIPNNGIDEDCDGMDLMVSVYNLISQNPQFFPNPTKSKLNIKINDSGVYALYLKNSKGETVLEKIIGENIQLDLINFPEGVYLILLQNENAVWTEKLVKIN